MSSYYPNFRSGNTGYTFAELAQMYANLRDIEYAGYYGNIRAGNLAKDPEMVIKSYEAKIRDFEEQKAVAEKIAANYKEEITTFYDSYKEAGLYWQAQQVQSSTSSTNNKDQDVLEDADLEDYINTYDRMRIKAILEVVVNFVVSFLFLVVLEMGIYGVLAGTTVSMVGVCIWWEISVVHRHALHRPTKRYTAQYVLQLVTAAAGCFAAYAAGRAIPVTGIAGLLLSGICAVAIFAVMLFGVWGRTRACRALIGRFLKHKGENHE